MHLKQVCIFPQKFPTHDCYPFNLDLFSQQRTIAVAQSAAEIGK